MTQFTETLFCNYRNLARRAQSSGHQASELKLLDKCIDIYGMMKVSPCTADTFVEMVNRRNVLWNNLNKKV